jgi:hypothetical protein
VIGALITDNNRDDMLIFRSYIEKAEDLIAFIGPLNQTSPFNPWVTVHAPLAFLHPPRYVPCMGKVLTSSVSRTTDAVRLAILAVGAVRLRFREEPNNPRSARQIATTAKDRVLHLLRDVIAEPSRYIDEVEGALAAILSCTVACVSDLCRNTTDPRPSLQTTAGTTCSARQSRWSIAWAAQTS